MRTRVMCIVMYSVCIDTHNNRFSIAKGIEQSSPFLYCVHAVFLTHMPTSLM